MTDLFPINLQDEIAEVEREIFMRERNYPRWVDAKKLRADIAEKQLAAMKAVAERLRKLQKESGR